jgi:two-component system NtrC family response regulator
MHFLHTYNGELGRNVRGFSAAAQDALARHDWPGNVRELENRVKRAVIMASGKLIQPSDLDLRPAAAGDPAGPPLGGGELNGAPFLPSPGTTLKSGREAVERTLVTAALLRHRGNVSAAAQELDISRPTLHDVMNKFGIDPNAFRPPKKNS